jgi:hypothetical protein
MAAFERRPTPASDVVKKILKDQSLTIYVDWIVDPQMNRSTVTEGTAAILRARLQKSRSLLYLFTNNSKRTRRSNRTTPRFRHRPRPGRELNVRFGCLLSKSGKAEIPPLPI